MLLYEAHGLENTALLGRNYALLGMSEEKMLKSWSPGYWPASHFEKALEGYRDTAMQPKAGEDKVVEVSFPDMCRVVDRFNKCVGTDFPNLGYLIVRSSRDNYFINGQGCAAYVLLKHPEKALCLLVCYHYSIYADGSHGGHWSVLSAFRTTDRYKGGGTYAWRKVADLASVCSKSYVAAAGHSSYCGFGGVERFDLREANTEAGAADVVRCIFDAYCRLDRVADGKLVEYPYVGVNYCFTDFNDDQFWENFNTAALFEGPAR